MYRQLYLLRGCILRLQWDLLGLLLLCLLRLLLCALSNRTISPSLFEYLRPGSAQRSPVTTFTPVIIGRLLWLRIWMHVSCVTKWCRRGPYSPKDYGQVGQPGLQRKTTVGPGTRTKLCRGANAKSCSQKMRPGLWGIKVD